jgi:hypothetical protein
MTRLPSIAIPFLGFALTVVLLASDAWAQTPRVAKVGLIPDDPKLI